MDIVGFTSMVSSFIVGQTVYSNVNVCMESLILNVFRF